jgi:hypothetical protein
LEPLNQRTLRLVVDRHDGNRGVGEKPGAWTCQRHLKTLLFAQFAGLQSLREIEQALAGRPAALYHLGLRLPRRSTLSDASAHRPAGVFKEICEQLMAQAGRRARLEGGALIRLLDASPIALRDERFGWAEADARCRGLKMHVLYDPRAATPVHFAVTSPKVADLTGARKIEIEQGTTLVFDKGYADYGWWHAIHAAGAIFVTRLKCNVHRRQVQPQIARGPDILAEQRLKLGQKVPRGGAKNALYDTPLREIVVARAGKTDMHLITNDLTRPAEEIAALYKERWQIELFFKWLKQNLKITRFLGRSENAVKMQIYIALIAFFLLRLFQDGPASSHKGGAKALMARLKVVLLQAFDLTNQAKPPPQPPNKRQPSPQLDMLVST